MNEKKVVSSNVKIWWILSIALTLLGAIGIAIMEIQRISLETIIAGVFAIGVLSLVVVGVYLLAFHDFKD